MRETDVIRALDAFGFTASDRGPLRVVPIECLRPNPDQPRKRFDAAGLQSLAGSIDTCGLLSPPLTHEVSGGLYELVAGERRWRACQLLGWATLPVLVQHGARGADALAAAMAENIAREDLNAVDEAHALAALLEEFGLTQEALGRRVGRSQEWISNSIRLLHLPDQVLLLLERGELTRAHGRALLSEPRHQERATLARRAVADGWTVRRLQAAIDLAAPAARARGGLPADALDAADRWTEALRTRTGHAMTIRATARGFQIDVGDQHAVRALLTRLGVAAEDLDE